MLSNCSARLGTPDRSARSGCGPSTGPAARARDTAFATPCWVVRGAIYRACDRARRRGRRRVPERARQAARESGQAARRARYGTRAMHVVSAPHGRERAVRDARRAPAPGPPASRRVPSGRGRGAQSARGVRRTERRRFGPAGVRGAGRRWRCVLRGADPRDAAAATGVTGHVRQAARRRVGPVTGGLSAVAVAGAAGTAATVEAALSARRPVLPGRLAELVSKAWAADAVRARAWAKAVAAAWCSRRWLAVGGWARTREQPARPAGGSGAGPATRVRTPRKRSRPEPASLQTRCCRGSSPPSPPRPRGRHGRVGGVRCVRHRLEWLLPASTIESRARTDGLQLAFVTTERHGPRCTSPSGILASPNALDTKRAIILWRNR
jgi:hypothetical protein